MQRNKTVASVRKVRARTMSVHLPRNFMIKNNDKWFCFKKCLKNRFSKESENQKTFMKNVKIISTGFCSKHSGHCKL